MAVSGLQVMESTLEAALRGVLRAADEKLTFAIGRWTTLLVSAWRANTAAAKLLLARGANLEARTVPCANLSAPCLLFPWCGLSNAVEINELLTENAVFEAFSERSRLATALAAV